MAKISPNPCSVLVSDSSVYIPFNLNRHYCRRIVRELGEYRIDPYYLLTFKFLVGTHSDSTSLKEFLLAKIAKRKKQIHPAHNPRFNHDLQLEIDSMTL